MKKKNKLKKLLPYAMSVCMLSFVAGCGSDDDDGSSGTSAPPQEQQEPNDGTYQATLVTLNTGIGGNTLAAGTANISVQGDAVEVTMNVNGSPVSIAHPQFIYVGGSCPTAADDANGDTYIDPVEGITKYGQILIPLDGDLNSQDAASGVYPFSDAAGAYSYTGSASLASMLADLTSPDTNPADSVAKLPAGSPLNLVGRTIVIHGVPGTTVLPVSVASIQGVPNTSSLPIACGVITRGTAGGTTGGTVGSTVGGTVGSTAGGTVGSTAGGTVGSTAGGTVGSTVGGTGGTTIGGTGGSTVGGASN